MPVSGPLSCRNVQSKIESLEADWKQLPQADIPYEHWWSGGMYCRQVTIPADTFLTGLVYKFDHFDVMLSGDITVSSDEGVTRLTGFHVLEGKQGKKRAGYAHAETRWLTFTPCPKLPLDECQDYVSVATFAELHAVLAGQGLIPEAAIRFAFDAQPSYSRSDYPMFKQGYLSAIGAQCREDADRADYAAFLSESGLLESLIREQSENTADQVEQPNASALVKPSPIEGKGLFARHSVSAGDVVMPARVGGKRTVAGRYVNHSVAPNCVMRLSGGDVDLVALRRIRSGEELTVDYRESLKLHTEEAA